MARDVKRKPPSRVKYEGSHPTVSCRVPKEVYDRLQAAKEAEGRSFVDFLKTGLGIIEVQAKEEGEVRKQAHAEGYKRGYADAERTFKVTYPCTVCRKTLTVTSPKEKEAIRQYMQEHGWGHKECHDRMG
jgi:predicted CopG family antitoxin